MVPEECITIYLIDDQPLVRRAIRCMLEHRGPFRVVGDSGSARDALQELGTLEPPPAVIILDTTVAGLMGDDAMLQLQRTSPGARLLMLTQHEGSSVERQALSHGASGYVSKDSPPVELVLAVRSVVDGRAFISPCLTRRVLDESHARNGSLNGSLQKRLVDRLSPRELEVFQLLTNGKTNKEIAGELAIALGTARKHRESVKRKLGCGTVAELVHLAVREQLLSV